MDSAFFKETSKSLFVHYLCACVRKFMHARVFVYACVCS